MDSTPSGAAGADVGCVVPQPAAITVKANIIETSNRDISLLFSIFSKLWVGCSSGKGGVVIVIVIVALAELKL